MSAFTLFSLALLAAVTIFALANPGLVMVRFLAWQFETTLALAVIGGAVIGGLLVFVSNVMGQQRLRAQVRDLHARLRELEGRAKDDGPASPSSSS